MYKMLVMDMDDTLLNNENQISEKNRQAIRTAKKKGIATVLCSGRPKSAMIKHIHDLGITDEGDYYISYNGAVITNVLTDEDIEHISLNPEIVEMLIHLGRKHGVDIQLYGEDVLYIEQYTQRSDQYIKSTKVEYKLVDDLLKYLECKTPKVLFNYEHKKLLEIQESLKVQSKNRFNMFFSKLNYLEFLDPRANKGTAMVKLAKKIGIRPETIIAVGDSYNDLNMIEEAGMGIAVANARDEVKKQADYIASRNNNQHVIEEVVEKYIL